MNNLTISLFLELIKSAIWNRKAEETLFTDIDEQIWTELVSFAESQSVSALLYDGIMTLPESVWPDRKIIYKLFLQTQFIEKRNRRFNEELKNIFWEYEKLNTPFILLKGQGNALFYPIPNHRSPGDIDLYLFNKSDYQKVNRWAVSNGYDMDDENIHHQGFIYNDIQIENHKNICFFGIDKYDKLFSEKIQNVVENNKFKEVEIEGLKVKVLPDELNAFYIFYHIFHHFIHLGIGMKQICDWVLFMKTNSDNINRSSFNLLVDSFDLSYAMKQFAAFAIKYLEAKPEYFPFETDIKGKYVDLILDDVFSGGNFGYDLFKRKTFQNDLHRKWYSFKHSTVRISRIIGLAPQHIKPLPYIKLTTNLKLLLTGKKY